MYCEVLPQPQHWRQAELGEKCPTVVEAIIKRVVPPMSEGHVRRTIASIVAEVVSADAKRQLTDVSTAPVQFAFGVGLIDLIELDLERRVHPLVASEARLGDPSIRPANRPTQVAPTSTEPSLEGQRGMAFHTDGTLLYMPPTVGNAKSAVGGASGENR